MSGYSYFRSKTRANLFAFGPDRTGSTLPPEDGPWEFVQEIPDEETWDHPANRDVVEIAVTQNGFYLWETA